MMFLNYILLLFCVTVWIQAQPELVWLEDLNTDQHLRHLEIGLPNHLEFNLKRQGGHQMKLRLQENTRLNANARMYEVVLEDGEQKARELDVPPIIGTKFYQDKRTGAALKISCTNQPYGACQRVLEGSLNIDGDSYEIKPSATMLHVRGMGSLRDAPHLIVKVEPPPEPQPGARVRGLYGADSKRISDEEKNEASEHDHKQIPGADSLPDEPDVRGVPEHDHKPIPELPEPNIQQELLDELRSLLQEEDLEDEIQDMFVEKKRSERAAGDLYAVEVVMVIDPALWKKYFAITDANNGMNKKTATEYFLRERLAHIMNGVSLRYESIEDNAMNVYVTISQFLVYKNVDSSNPLSPSVNIPVVDGVQYADSDVYIDGLPAWAQRAPITSGHDDHIMVITGYELYYDGNTNNDGVAGVAFVRGACGYYRTSVQEDGDYFVLTSVAAHELGHNLGADHDSQGSSSSCPKNDKYLMAPYITTFSRGEAYSVNPWRFSSCSIKAFKKYFGSGRCFGDPGDYYNKDEWNKHNQLQPGERISPDEQCKLIKGDNSYRCTSNNDNPGDICRTMKCYDSDDGYCYYYAAARGTPCGDSMWCIDGQCVERDVIATTTQAPGTTTTQAPGTTTTQAPGTTTTQAPGTTTTESPTTTTSSCVDIGWYDWSCQRVSNYFYQTYFYEPSYWCQDPYWAKACCVFCRDALNTDQPSTTTTTTMAPTSTESTSTESTSTESTSTEPTSTESCVDRGYYNWSCKRISKYFRKTYGYKPKHWCTDPEWKYNCCEYCADRGF